MLGVEYGDHKVKIIKSTNGHDIKVDNEDFEWLNQWRWNVNKWKKYKSVQRSIWHKDTKKKDVVKMSRQIMRFPKGMHVDHVNHNTLDNRRCNLRVCTMNQNNKNYPKPCTNTLGYKGIHFAKRNYHLKKPWYSLIRVDSKTIYLGYYKTAKKAHEAYCEAALKYHGEFANFGENREVQFA